MRRLGLWIVLGLLVALAGVSTWLKNTIEQRPTPAETTTNEPDFFLENFRMLDHDREGRPYFELTGRRLTRFPAEARTLVQQPVMRFFEPGQPDWTVESERAVADSRELREVALAGEVTLIRAPAPERGAIHIDTRDVTVWPAARRAATDAPVTMRSGLGRVVARQGMRADLTKGVVEMQRVTAHYEP